MRTLVLTMIEQPAPGQVPLELFEWENGARKSIAQSTQAVSASDVFEYEGKDVNLVELLTQGDKECLEAAGTHLYERLLLDGVKAELGKAGHDTRVMLDIHGQALAGVPWEMMRRNDLVVFGYPGNPWCRGTPEQREPPAPLRSPLADPPPRILIIVGSARDDKAALGDDELRAIEDALHECKARILVDVLVRESSETIRTAVAKLQPSVIHFIGHGVNVGGQPTLELVTDQGNSTVYLDRDFLRGLFTKARLPRLVVLNACETAQMIRSWDLAHIFEEAGVLATLTMQAEIRGSAAVRFSRIFYKELAAGAAVDVAVANARSDLVSHVTDHDTRMNWPIPRLVLHGDPEAVIPWPARKHGPPRVRVNSAPDFVHRWPQRREVWDSFFPHNGAQASRLCVLRGAEGSGKTEFLRLLGEMWTRVCGHLAVYVDLKDLNTTSSFALLLDRLIAALEAAGLDCSDLEKLDRALPVPKLARQVQEILEQRTPEEAQLLVLIDGMERWNKEVLAYEVLESLCSKFASPKENSRVRLGVALRPEHADSVEWEKEHGVTPIAVGNFTPSEWVRAATLFIRLRARMLNAARLARFNQSAWSQLGLEPPDKLVSDDPGFDPQFLGYLRRFAELVDKP